MNGGGFPRPRKRLGQHFLTDASVLARIADALAVVSTDTVVEIGPGRGALTALLLQRAARVVAIELDRDLVALLRDRFAADTRLTVVERDVLDVPLAGAAGSDDFVLAGNVPYYITTPILFHALDPPLPRRAVFLVQREVAERAVSPPGSKVYGALSVNLQALATPELVAIVPPRAFSPPRVESAILLVTPRADPVIALADQAKFSAFVIAAFGLRRKQMRRVVRTLTARTPDDADRVLRTAGIDPEARPETLSDARFAALFHALAGR